MEKLVLIDGNSIAFRAFFALPPLQSSSGTYTNAVYGFTMMLLKVLEEERPTHLLVAFDAGRETFRHEDYKEYKGTRDKTPGELSEQIPLIHEVLDAFGIRHFELDRYEADDIIGTLAKTAEEAGLPTRIVSGDRDLLQLVSDQVHVLVTRKGVTEVDVYDPKAVKEKYNLKPEQIIDLKGLMGDASDNIPGIPGVGEKTALKLLHQYGTLENVLQHQEELPGKKLRERVKEHREQAELSKRLATIHREVPLDLTLEDLRYTGFDREKVLPLFRKLEFRQLIDRLGSEEEAASEPEEISFQMVTRDTTSSWESLLEKKRLALFVELSNSDYHRGDLLGLALSDGETQLFLLPEVAREWPSFIQWLQDDKKEKIVYDSKRTRVALQRQGWTVQGLSFDLLLASYVLDPSESGHELSDIVRRKTTFQLPEDEAVYGKGAKRRQLEGEELAEHLARKTAVMVKLAPILLEELKQADLEQLLFDLEQPLAEVLAKMEERGIKIDRERLEGLGEELQGRLDQLTEEIHALAGGPFNINSPKQLGEVLFDRLGLPVIKKTKTGYSTSADVLEKLAPQHEIVEKILHYRQVGKLVSTYVEGLLKVIDPKTGKVHTRFNQAITATGRLSSTDPNLQNIPIRLEEGRRIRQVFIPSEPEWLILGADYSQIELRILAHLSQDVNLCNAFRSDMDIHTRTAMDVFGVAEDEVTPLMRYQSKAVNFGIIYGISDYGLSQNLNISRKEAGEFIERYFTSYPGVKEYMDRVIQQAKRDGYVTTLLNRRRYLPEINSRNFNRRSFAERTAMNTPIQGTAADIIKTAMVNLDRELVARKLKSRMLLQVHDELIFEVLPEEQEELTALVREVMENTVELSVPLKVDISVGKTWYEV